jgi:hypothetical protein
VDAVFVPMQQELFKNQAVFEKEVLEISNQKKRKKILTEYTIEHAEQAVKKAWKLGDDIWTKYDELF